tara:strand:+ start:495 stop:752 length:258 start_codon:yes stop_codon:yes gene_type:complete
MLKRTERIQQYVGMVTKVGDIFSCQQMVARMTEYNGSIMVNDSGRGFVLKMAYIPSATQLGALMGRDDRFIGHRNGSPMMWERIK